MNSEQALKRLLIGNRRYSALRQVHPRQTGTHRQTLVEGQHPFAAILSCSDSRVPSELFFDQGLGDLFIVRTAGHTVNELVRASLEYAVFALHVPLLLVLGHARIDRRWYGTLLGVPRMIACMEPMQPVQARRHRSRRSPGQLSACRCRAAKI